MNTCRLLNRYFTTSVRSQLQYPASTFMLTFGQLISTSIEIISIWALFERFGTLQGWSFGEVAFFYSLLGISFAIAEFISRGFEVFGTQFVRTGDFDRLLLRPRSAILQLIGHEFRISRFGRLLQATIILIVASHSLHFIWSPHIIGLVFWTVAGGVAFFIALFIFQSALAFWTVEGLEAINAFTYGGVYAGQFPISLYENWLRIFLTFVVPLACISYYPVLAILGRPDPMGAPDWLLPLTPLAGFIFLTLASLIWQRGISKYTSTGS